MSQSSSYGNRRPGRLPDAAGAAAGRAWRVGMGGIARAAFTIADRVGLLEQEQLRLRTGTLLAHTSTSGTVSMGGADDLDVDLLASYAPVDGDTVLILQTRGQLLIIGKAK